MGKRAERKAARQSDFQIAIQSSRQSQ